MTWKCAFKKLYTVAVNLGSTAICPPNTFNGFWCLVDELSLLSLGSAITLESTDEDLVLGPWAEDRLFFIYADPENPGAFEYQEEGSVAVSVNAGGFAGDLIEAGNTVTLIAPGPWPEVTVRYYTLIA